MSDLEKKLQAALGDNAAFMQDADKLKSAPEGRGELSFGEKACGITFNPGGNPDVDGIKRLFAWTIDDLNLRRNLTDNPEKKRMYSIAITELQTAQMWAVKAATWQY